MKNFQLAVQKAKQATGEQKWNALDFAQQSSVIYRELRLLDAELAHDQSVDRKIPATSHHPAQPSSSQGRPSVKYAPQRADEVSSA